MPRRAATASVRLPGHASDSSYCTSGCGTSLFLSVGCSVSRVGIVRPSARVPASQSRGGGGGSWLGLGLVLGLGLG